MKSIFVPHPVLRPSGADYQQGVFDMSLTDKPQYTLDGKILVPVQFNLESKFINKLIHDKKARITVVIKCPRTYERTIVDVDGLKSMLELSRGSYADKIWLSPHVSATEPIEHFKSKEHHAEFSDIEINLPAGAILARGSDTELTIDALQTLSAAIHLMTENSLEKGQYSMNVGGDHIEIYMHEETRRGVESMRKTSKHLLYPSVYMTVLTHAIQNITTDGDRKWEESLRKTLKNIDVPIDNEEDLQRNAYMYAQKLLKYPVRFITAPVVTEMEIDTDE